MVNAMEIILSFCAFLLELSSWTGQSCRSSTTVCFDLFESSFFSATCSLIDAILDVVLLVIARDEGEVKLKDKLNLNIMKYISSYS